MTKFDKVFIGVKYIKVCVKINPFRDKNITVQKLTYHRSIKSSRRSSSTSSTNKKRKVAAIRRSTTCLDIFQPHEIMHACEICQPKLDPLSNNRKSNKNEHEKSKRNTCRKYWEAHNASKHQSIALRHKQVCEYLEIPVGTLFKDECAYSKGANDMLDNNKDIVTDVNE